MTPAFKGISPKPCHTDQLPRGGDDGGRGSARQDDPGRQRDEAEDEQVQKAPPLDASDQRQVHHGVLQDLEGVHCSSWAQSDKNTGGVAQNCNGKRGGAS